MAQDSPTVSALTQPAAPGYGTGCVVDAHDPNDKLLFDLYLMDGLDMNEVYQNIVQTAEKLPEVTLEGFCPPIYDQYGLGSCVANATAAALRFTWKKLESHQSMSYEAFEPSRLWIYYYARLLGDPDSQFRDTGCQIRDALKVLRRKGVCTEEAWKYLSKSESDAVEKLQKDTKDPDAMPSDCRAGIMPATANDENVTKLFDFKFSYHRIRSLSDDQDKALAPDNVIQQMCACLTEGFPIVFGLRMYFEANNTTDEFFDDRNWNGDVFLVNDLEKRGNVNGGHALLCVGFNREKKLFRVMNSWSDGWKDKGFFWMPFEWFEHPKTTHSLWTIRHDL